MSSVHEAPNMDVHNPGAIVATLEPMALTVNGEGITFPEFEAEVARFTAAQTALGKTVDIKRLFVDITLRINDLSLDRIVALYPSIKEMLPEGADF